MSSSQLAMSCLGALVPLTWGMLGAALGCVFLFLALMWGACGGRLRSIVGLVVVLLFACALMGLAAMRLQSSRTGSVTQILTFPGAELPADVEVPVPVAVADAGVLEPGHYIQTTADGQQEYAISFNQERGESTVAVTTHSKPRLPGFLSKFSPDTLWSVIAACAIAALMFVGYIALDAGTRGHFTWSLRVLSVLCFGAIITVVVALRHAL